jgi:chemotaxis signal transduction protein
VIGFVTFTMGGRTLAGRLGEVREVVRATGLERLDGARAPVTALLILRGQPVPVVDLRADPVEAGDSPGDVLVLAVADGVLGLAVDRVHAVLGEAELVPAQGDRGVGLPAYVLEVRRDVSGAPVFVVSLTALAGLLPV